MAVAMFMTMYMSPAMEMELTSSAAVFLLEKDISSAVCGMQPKPT